MLDEKLLDAIYAIVSDDEALTALLAGLAERFDCISAALVYRDRSRRAAEVAAGHGVFDADAQARYLKHYASIDPAPAVIAALPLGLAAATDRLFTQEEKLSSRFLAEFYHPLGLYEALAAPIVRAEGRSGILAVHRGENRSPFADGEIEEFGEIALHVARAVALRNRFFSAYESLERRGAMLDSVASGIMVVERDGRLLEANAAARAILARSDALVVSREGRVRALDKKAEGRLNRAFVEASSAPLIVQIPRDHDQRPYALKISANASTSPLQAITVRISDDDLPGDAAKVLMQALGLSASSAAVTAALIRGEDMRVYARQAGISENTVKFHLKSAFRATGTRRQSELVQVATTVVRDLLG